MEALRILLSLIPPISTGLFASVMLMFGFREEMILLPGIFANVMLASMMVPLFVIWHEVGHILAGMLVGGVPRFVDLGGGYFAGSWEINGVFVTLRSQVNQGAVSVEFPPGKVSRAREAIFYAGAPLANLLMVIAVLLVAGDGLWGLEEIRDINLAWAILLSNLMLATWSLLPVFVSQKNMQKMASDGMRLLQLRSMSQEELQKENEENRWGIGFMTLFHKRNYEEAREYLLPKLKDEPENLRYQLMHLGVLGGMERFEEMMEIINRLLGETVEEEEAWLRPWLYMMAALGELIAEDAEKALGYAQQALDLDAKRRQYWAVRGAALVMSGEYKKGIRRLSRVYSWLYPDLAPMVAAIFLMRAYRETGNARAALKVQRYCQRNEKHFPKELLFLYKRELAHITAND